MSPTVPAQGGVVLTMHAFYHTLRISIPTVVNATVGSLTPEKCDFRLRDWADSLVRATRTRVTVAGHQHIPSEPCIVMSNHRSLSDIPILYSALPLNIRLRMIAKAELFKVPIWGRAMRLAGFIPIVRTDRAQAIQSLEEAKQGIRSGTFVWIAPEGTRSRNGELGPLKKGGFILARETGLPILPVALDGSERVLPPTGIKTYYDQPAHVEFRPVIPTVGRSIEEVMADVRRAIDPRC